MEEGKMSGKGRLYDAERDEVMEGEFEHNKKQGEGYLYQRNGHVLKGNFRNNQMEGTFENVFKITKKQVKKVFANSQLTNNAYIAVNSKNEARVQKMLKEQKHGTSLDYPLGRDSNDSKLNTLQSKRKTPRLSKLMEPAEN